MQPITIASLGLPVFQATNLESISMRWKWRRGYYTVDRANAIKIAGGKESDLPPKGQKKLVNRHCRGSLHLLYRGPFGRWIVQLIDGFPL